MILPVSMTGAGIAALINIWLAIRCGQVRSKEKIDVGDGGNNALVRRMRAHSNFAEFTPIVLILFGLVEYAAGTSTWLWAAMAIYMVGRVLHGIGMDEGKFGRAPGIMITMLVTVGLGLYAIALPHLGDSQVEEIPQESEVLPAEG
jgi:uncharacterized protein